MTDRRSIRRTMSETPLCPRCRYSLADRREDFAYEGTVERCAVRNAA